MKLYRKTRHALYKRMLERYKEGYLCSGFCSLIKDVENINWYEVYCYMNALPELMKYKPKRVFYTCEDEKCRNHYQFWFPISNTKKRIKILEECIRLTAPKEGE